MRIPTHKAAQRSCVLLNTAYGGYGCLHSGLAATSIQAHLTNITNINLIAKGENGRWLDVKQKGRNYSGGLYVGDTKLADVTAVRGIPGVLFPNGEFESLF